LLRNERLLRGWSQQDLADRLGATAVTVSRWECGVQQPGPALRRKLCLLFGKSEDELGLSSYVLESMTDLQTEASQENILSLYTPTADSQQSGSMEASMIGNLKGQYISFQVPPGQPQGPHSTSQA
jgi:transcriptional regulator with XRE-family HTH domain